MNQWATYKREREREKKHYSFRHFILKFDYNIAIKEEMVLEWEREIKKSGTEFQFALKRRRRRRLQQQHKWTMASMSMCHHCETLAAGQAANNSIEACVLHRGSEKIDHSCKLYEYCRVLSLTLLLWMCIVLFAFLLLLCFFFFVFYFLSVRCELFELKIQCQNREFFYQQQQQQ